MKSTGHEKVCVTVCLPTAAADGRKLKPMIMFKGAKRDSILLNQESKGWCFIVSSANGWMNEDLTLNFVKIVVWKTVAGMGLFRVPYDGKCKAGFEFCQST